METEIKIPDIGGASKVDVIEILVKVGDVVKQEDSLVTLESDKASMEIPSPFAGKVNALRINIGDKVSEGDVILTLDTEEIVQEAPKEAPKESPKELPVEPEPVVQEVKPITPVIAENGSTIFAGPAVRRLARELGVDLATVKGTGPKARISKDDLQKYIKTKLQTTSGGLQLPTAPAIDFSQFGAIETKPLHKIKKITGINMQRAWLTVPHVTQFDEADVTELEEFRKQEITNGKNSVAKLTLLAFVCKVVAKALQTFPQFNTSLDASGEQLIYKQYINIGIAVDTPNGLVVPVIKGVDNLSIYDIAMEMARLSEKARDKGLMPAEMSGGCFTISSLGGIGGTAFTPIVNTPEVAILGLSRSAMKPVYQNGQFVPRLMLPLSLSYDHRVIDGAEAARFTQFLCTALQDIRKILL